MTREPRKTVWVERFGHFNVLDEERIQGHTVLDEIRRMFGRSRTVKTKPVLRRRYVVQRVQNTLDPVVGEYLAESYLEDLIEKGYTVNIS